MVDVVAELRKRANQGDTICNGGCYDDAANMVEAEIRRKDDALRAVLSDHADRTDLLPRPGEDVYATRARLNRTCRCGSGCGRSGITLGCSGPYDTDYERDDAELLDKVRAALAPAVSDPPERNDAQGG